MPVSLHLGHCPDREWINICLEAGWSSVLFDGSHLDVIENTRQTIEVVAEASVTRTMGMALCSCTPPAKGSPLFDAPAEVAVRIF